MGRSRAMFHDIRQFFGFVWIKDKKACSPRIRGQIVAGGRASARKRHIRRDQASVRLGPKGQKKKNKKNVCHRREPI